MRINTYLVGMVMAWAYLCFKYPDTYKVKAFRKMNDLFTENTLFRYCMYVCGAALTTTSLMLQHLIDYYGIKVKPY